MSPKSAALSGRGNVLKKKVTFQTIIHKFGSKGEKSGWTYIDIPSDVALRLYPGNKKAFRVSGVIDQYPINKVAILPMGDGHFIMPLNATIRKGIHKNTGAMVSLTIVHDRGEIKPDHDLMECLEEDPAAKDAFFKLTPGHRNYFSKWIESAKTSPTKTKRIAMTLDALANGMDFGAMLRAQKAKR